MKPLSGKKALVTGATRGIGWVIAERLNVAGAAVTATGTSPDGRAPKGCSYCTIDLNDDSATAQFANEVSTWELDILINNAGVNKIGPFESIDLRDWDMIQRVNLRAPFVLCQKVLPGMRKRRWGRVVNIASIFSTISKELRASYSASKYGLDGLTAALAAEVAQDGILANCVSPGFIDTDLTREILGEDGIKELVKQVPAGRLGTPAEVATLVTWLAGPENTYVSGQNIVIDGGFSRV